MGSILPRWQSRSKAIPGLRYVYFV